MRKIKLLTSVGIIGVVTAPAVLAVSCGDSPDPKSAESSEQIINEMLNQAAAQKEKEKIEAQSKIDAFVLDGGHDNYSPSLTMTGEETSFDEIASNFILDRYFVKTTVSDLICQVVGAVVKEDGDLVLEVRVSSNVEGTTSKTFTYTLINTNHEDLVSPTNGEITNNEEVSNPENHVQTELEKTIEQFNSNDYVPSFVSSFTNKVASSVLVSDFEPIKIINNVEYSVASVSNPKRTGELTVSVYAYSSELEQLHDPKIPFERVYDVKISNLVPGGEEHQIFNAISWGDLPVKFANSNVYFPGGIHTFALGQSMSLILNIATDLGWQRDVTKPVPATDGTYSLEQQNAILGFSEMYERQRTYSTFDLGLYNASNHQTIGDKTVPANQAENLNLAVYLNPLGDNSRPTGRELGRVGIFHPKDIDGTSIREGLIDINPLPSYDYGNLHSVSHYSSWIDYKTPGIVYTELEQSGTSKPHNDEAYEWMLESSDNFAKHDYPIASMKESAYYVDLIESILLKTKLLAETIESEASAALASRALSEDFVEAVQYIGNTEMPSRSWLYKEFEQMNNGTFYWPSIEIFVRGITGIPKTDQNTQQKYWGDRNELLQWRAAGQQTYNLIGFSSIQSFSQLMKWASDIHNVIELIDETGVHALRANDNAVIAKWLPDWSE